MEDNPDVLAYIMLAADGDAEWLTENRTLLTLAKAVPLQDVNPEDLIQKLIEASHPMWQAVNAAFGFNGKVAFNRLDWFTPKLTSMGMCYRFNKTELVKYPGNRYGLQLVSLVKPDEYFYNVGSFGSVGLKVQASKIFHRQILELLTHAQELSLTKVNKHIGQNYEIVRFNGECPGIFLYYTMLFGQGTYYCIVVLHIADTSPWYGGAP